MRPSDELFKLIKSLTKAEKIYFKKFSQRHVIGKENKYVKLFNAIDKLENIYDEKKIRENFKGDRFVKQIHVAKNYLFNLILDSLAEQYSSNDDEFIQLDSLKKIKIMMDKGLSKSTYKALKKNKNKALEFERFYIAIKLYEYERRWAMYLNLGKDTYKKIQRIAADREELMNRLTEHMKYRSLYESAFFHFLRHVNTRESSDEKELDKILNTPIVSDKIPNTFYSMQYFCKLKTMSAQRLNDSKLYYKYSKISVDSFEKFPVFKKDLILYHSAIYDMLSHKISTNNLAEYYTYYQKFSLVLEELSKGNKRQKALAFHSQCMLDLRFARLTNNKSALYKTAMQIKDELNNHNQSLNLRQIMDIQIAAAIALFRSEHYEESLSFVNTILNIRDSFKIPEIYNMGLILSLFIHYEMGHNNLIEYTTGNIKKYLKDKRKLFETENLIINFFNKVIKLRKKEALREEFEILNNKINKLKDNPYENGIINELNLMAWINRKKAFNTRPYS